MFSPSSGGGAVPDFDDDPLESFETEDIPCTCCGAPYRARELDRGLCATCEDYEDFLELCD